MGVIATAKRRRREARLRRFNAAERRAVHVMKFAPKSAAKGGKKGAK